MFIGKVIAGSRLGKKYGYPTANLEVKQKDLNLKSGVYAAYAVLNDRKYRAALVIRDTPRVIEVHLLDYSDPDFYGADLQIKAVKKIAEIIKCDSERALIKKIKSDIKKIKSFLPNAGLPPH